MSEKQIIIWSTLSAFAISFCGSIIVALIAIPKGERVSTTIWVVCLATGILSAAKDVRSLLKLPPVPTEKTP